MMLLKKLFKMREQSSDEAVKPFLDHLEDLRWTIMKIAITLVAGMTLCFTFRHEVFEVLQYPLLLAGMNPKDFLIVTALPEVITVAITISFYAALVLSFPVLLYFLAQFILPALTQKEKRVVFPALGVGFALFLLGAACCFFYILPPTIQWLGNEADKLGIRGAYKLREYCGFVTHFVIGFGLLAELPVVTVVLNRLGVLSYKWLASTRAYAFMLILILAMIISPTPDVMMMLILAAPIVVLYEFCIWLIWFMEKSRIRKERKALFEDKGKDDGDLGGE